MDGFVNDETPRYRKKKSKKTPKKTDHKHQYELIDIKIHGLDNWFNYQYICKICGKAGNKIRIEEDDD